ncbi:hypothetical protein [Streptomyces sp. 061-3]|uniref:hypothetical protein n=1 Tax=Streptomyces sp. 061-3 TaxID=2789268 RepID=UPI00397EE1D1
MEQPLGFLERDGGCATFPALDELADQVVQGRGDFGGDSPELESERAAAVDDVLGGEAADAANGLGKQQQEQAGSPVGDLELLVMARWRTRAQRWSLLMIRAAK